MSINLITGYDLNKDECGHSRNTASHIVFAPYTAFISKSELHDDSDTEWLYNQKNNIEE
jgi:3-mercaptopyruvate sulfurtransferase SseA